MRIAIVGGGIAGLSLALNLHKRGIACTVYEAAPAIKELGVGITLLPHAMRELAALGLQTELEQHGIVNQTSAFFNRFGQMIYQEPRGRAAGYPYPEVGIHRGRLHGILLNAARRCLDGERLFTNHRCSGLSQDEAGVTLHFTETSTDQRLPDVHADVVIACDGVNSAIRRTFYPSEKLVFTGINTWRGVTRHRPILSGRTYVRIGSIKTAKLILYPIMDNIDGDGRQLINWSTELETKGTSMNDWNTPGRIADFIDFYQDWRFDWLDVPALIRGADTLFEYPMVDKNPIDQWTFGGVTLVGDAAHPMYPRGSNGSAQALIDARTLAECLAGELDPRNALKRYEELRCTATARVVLTNRSTPPDIINIRVEELTHDRPFGNLDDHISQAELKELSDAYKRVAGFDLADLR